MSIDVLAEVHERRNVQKDLERMRDVLEAG
jgi:hypothetical protein